MTSPRSSTRWAMPRAASCCDVARPPGPAPITRTSIIYDTMNDFTPLARAAEHARSFLATLAERPVRESGAQADLRRALALPLPDEGLPAVQVIDDLVR